jgi:serine/threonine protein kinase
MNEPPWPEAMAIFDELLAQDEAARARRLARIRDEAPALAACIARLLQADAGGGPLDDGLADHSPSMMLALAQSLDAGSDAEDLSGTSLGPFQLLRRLGTGGMGEVYVAERERAGARQQVALKRLASGLLGPEWLSRFQREHRILAQLNHPHIASFVDAGVDAEGRPWFAMELVEGEPLTSFARRLALRDRVQLLARVGDAVAYAHGRLVVHRDLKPPNILVDAHGEPRILDFGIATLLASPGGETTILASRAISPAYAAPEQILGEPASVSMDVYALGVILYELVTGEVPHRRAARSLEGLVHELGQEVTRPPSQRLRDAATTRSGGLDPALDADLDLIALKALRRERDRRYGSVADLVEDLRRWLARQPIRARPDGWRYRLDRFVHRHRGGVIAAAISVLALLSGLGIALWQAGEAREHARRAEAEAAHATRIRDFLTGSLHAARARLSTVGAELKFGDWALATAERIDRDLADAPLERAEMRTTLARVLDDVGESRRAMALHEQAIAELRALGAAPDVLGDALHGFAMALNDAGDLDRSEALLAEAMRGIDARAVDPDLTEAARRTLRLKRIALRTTALRNANDRGDYAGALAISRSNLDDRRALLGDDAPELAVDYNNLGANLATQGRGQESEQAFLRAERLLRAMPEPPQSRFAYIEHGLGMAKLAQGRLEEALAHLEQAGETGMRTLGPGHRFVAEARVHQANVLLLQGRVDAAQVALDASTSILREQAIEPDHRTRLVEARIALARRDPVAADAALDAAASQARAASAESIYREQLAALRALAQAQHGRAAAAIARCDEARRSLAADARAVLPRRAETHAYCAQAYRVAGDAARAAQARAEAEALWSTSMGPAAAAGLLRRIADG